MTDGKSSLFCLSKNQLHAEEQVHDYMCLQGPILKDISVLVGSIEVPMPQLSMSDTLPGACEWNF